MCNRDITDRQKCYLGFITQVLLIFGHWVASYTNFIWDHPCSLERIWCVVCDVIVINIYMSGFVSPYTTYCGGLVAL